MTITEEATQRLTNEEAAAFAKKLEAFERGLTPNERRLFQRILTEFGPVPSTDDDEAILWAGDAE